MVTPERLNNITREDYLESIKRLSVVIPDDTWTDEDYVHFATINSALWLAAEKGENADVENHDDQQEHD